MLSIIALIAGLALAIAIYMKLDRIEKGIENLVEENNHKQ